MHELNSQSDLLKVDCSSLFTEGPFLCPRSSQCNVLFDLFEKFNSIAVLENDVNVLVIIERVQQLHDVRRLQLPMYHNLSCSLILDLLLRKDLLV